MICQIKKEKGKKLSYWVMCSDLTLVLISLGIQELPLRVLTRHFISVMTIQSESLNNTSFTAIGKTEGYSCDRM